MSSIKGMSTVFLNVSTTSGQKRLLRSDVKIPEDFKLQELARLGTKTVFNLDDLRPFANIRKNGQNFLGSVGIRFGGGYGVPDAKLSFIKEKMEGFKSQFEAYKKELLATYCVKRDVWLEDIKLINPELAQIISENVISREYLESQIQFTFHTEEDESKLAGDKLVQEVAEAADIALQRLAGQGKNKLNRKSLVYLTSIKEKLESMSFLNQSVVPTIHRIEGFLSSIPEKNTLGIEWFQGLVRELSFLKDPDNFALLSSEIEVSDEVNDLVKSAGTGNEVNLKVMDADIASHVDPAILEFPMFAQSGNETNVVIASNTEMFF